MYTRLFSRTLKVTQSQPIRNISGTTTITPKFKLTGLDPVDFIIRGVRYFNHKSYVDALDALNRGLDLLKQKKTLTMDEEILRARALTCKIKILSSRPEELELAYKPVKEILDEVKKNSPQLK
jgi:hypothetical protein